MKSSTSWPPSSRKYSAIVRPESATRMRAPGGSFIWPKTSTVRSITPDSFISSQRSLPSRERSPTPQNADRPSCSSAMFRISSWIEHGLAHPGAAEQADLAALGVGREQVDDLDAGLEDLARRGQVLDARRRPVDRPAVVGLHVAALVDRLAEQVEDAAERGPPDRHRDRAAGVAHLRAAREAVGGVHRDRAHAVVAEVLLHLEDEDAGVVLVALVLELDLERVVDLGQLARGRRPRRRRPGSPRRCRRVPSPSVRFSSVCVAASMISLVSEVPRRRRRLP